ncbi:MAG TPA: phosphoglucomutase (alpha-D-glucose-1,6-bisphosphate-dependent) [Phycisphaerae bacterium]|nr:phosphoglucomutase (alpha-D-glucose-1,6-bisphosphate-dependent) [Phycisphaerae bacterium]
MPLSPLAGKPAPASLLIDPAKLERAYFDNRPDFSSPAQRVSFGTSGHRGTSTNSTFTEAHILAITQAVCDYRRSQKIDGPILLAQDTHALSAAAQRTALEVLAANNIQALIQSGPGITPVPVVSRAVINYNRNRTDHLADALIATPSHNPPADGGFKYNPPNGGPATSNVTSWIQNRANELLQANNKDVRRTPYESVRKASTTQETDFILPYVRDLALAINIDAIKNAGLKLGVDPLGGAALFCWEPINRLYGLSIEVVNTKVDPTFSFMSVDHDGVIRMDCSSPYAMAGLVNLKDRFRVAFGNDPDSDRFGIVTPSAGLMSPNHVLAVAIRYLLMHRPQWSPEVAVGKTVVSSSMIDRVVASLGRRLAEVPVGFKFFAEGLFDGTMCFGGEESAGASFLQMNKSPWTTDKDGVVMNMLAAEITAVTGKDPSEHYRELTAQFGTSYYTRIDTPATPQQKAALKKLSPDAVRETTMAGEPITAKLTRAPHNDAPIDGLKVATKNGWFAARPSGTENIYKIYAESFISHAHLDAIVHEAQQIVTKAVS